MQKAVFSFFLGLLLFITMPSEAQNQFDSSQSLKDLIFLALDHGVNSIRQGGPLVPFTIFDIQGKHSINRFVTEPYENAVAEAKTSIAKLPPNANLYVIAYDGFITVDGKKVDAIIIHAAERGKGEAYILAQRYIPAKDGSHFKTLGNPAFIGREDALLQ